LGSGYNAHPSFFDDPFIDFTTRNGPVSSLAKPCGVPVYPHWAMTGWRGQTEMRLKFEHEKGTKRLTCSRDLSREYVARFRDALCKEALEEIFGLRDPDRVRCCCGKPD
jgi:hypothetical protein